MFCLNPAHILPTLSLGTTDATGRACAWSGNLSSATLRASYLGRVLAVVPPCAPLAARRDVRGSEDSA